jgi:F-type H+-transporting ATPase subunit b
MRSSGVCLKGYWVSILFMVATIILSAGSASAAGIKVMPDASTFIQIVNFVFLIWALNIVLYRPIRNILLQRKEKVEGFEQKIEASLGDAREKDTAFATGIKAARVKGLKEKESLMADAALQEKEIIESINKKAQSDLAEIRAKISKDASDVEAALKVEVDSFASAIGQKILGRAV